MNAIIERTGLPIGLDRVFRWAAFSRSRMNPRISVPNRYFGVFQDVSLKIRGIEARQRDVPPIPSGITSLSGYTHVSELIAIGEEVTEPMLVDLWLLLHGTNDQASYIEEIIFQNII